jgi:hypothetical protein
MNNLDVIFPCKRDGIRAFDDGSVGLLQELWRRTNGQKPLGLMVGGKSHFGDVGGTA